MLLAVVAVASGVTITCCSGGIGLYDPGWDAAFLDAAAKKAGGITRVASVETVPTRVLGFYARFCTVVHGE